MIALCCDTTTSRAQLQLKPTREPMMHFLQDPTPKILRSLTIHKPMHRPLKFLFRVPSRRYTSRLMRVFASRGIFLSTIRKLQMRMELLLMQILKIMLADEWSSNNFEATDLIRGHPVFQANLHYGTKGYF